MFFSLFLQAGSSVNPSDLLSPVGGTSLMGLFDSCLGKLIVQRARGRLLSLVIGTQGLLSEDDDSTFIVALCMVAKTWKHQVSYNR